MQVDFLFGFVPDLPFATVSAALFYLVIAASFYPPIGRYLVKHLSMPKPATQTHLAPLDVYRGLAALLVATSHTWNRTYPIFSATQKDLAPFLAFGAKAVPIFVILSGFLIYRSVKKIDSADGLKDYFERRFRRIYPAYFATTLACVALGFIPWEISPILGEFTMLRSLYYNQIAQPTIWSLYVEVLFYLLMPVLVIYLRRAPILIASLALLAFAAADQAGPRELQLWKYFCFGVIAAEFVEAYAHRMTQAVALAIFGAGCALFWIDFTNFDWVEWLFGSEPRKSGYSLGLGLACMLILIGTSGSRAVGRAFSITPLRILGNISYSLFLWHSFYLFAVFPPQGIGGDKAGRQLLRETLPVLNEWYLPLVILPGIIFWSMVSFALIERPFLRRRSEAAVAPRAASVPSKAAR